MRSHKRTYMVGVVLFLLMMVTGLSCAGKYDFNPGKYALKHDHELEQDVEGEGYVMVYQKIDTNNLSLDQYSHGSGIFDEAEKLHSLQKTSSKYYVLDEFGGWVNKPKGANSLITMTKQSDDVQAPFSFPYGTGWYAAHPVTYNSLLKDKTVAKSYQEATMMHHQVEYARAFRGDLEVEINCTGPTETADGKGLTSMDLEDEVTMGTVHIGELQTRTLFSTPSAFKDQGWKNPIIEVDEDFVGNFKIQKKMKVDASKSKSSHDDDWLPCCSGGFDGLLAYGKGIDKEWGDQIRIFDCTCLKTSRANMYGLDEGDEPFKAWA
ncbi:MAG: hypothetical protein JW986_01260 [Methanotrichaceae archaeon]|nr:hypothetical protein [Methanotrichaceae archaeon]